ncbi:MAG: patatin-like phospholipase family protein [Myxococcaceae bacterium]
MPRTLQQLLAGKRFGLVLSAGYFGFYGHTGFLKGLLAAGLEPAAYAGTSAGGLIGALAAAGAAIGDIEALLQRQTRKSFWDPAPLGALLGAAMGDHRASGLLEGGLFRELLERALPVRTFEECRRPLVLAAANLSLARTAVFTRGELAPRVHATCAYPGLFRAVDIDGELFWDGGLVDKAPVLALAESEAGRGLDALLVHYLPSRTRPDIGGAFAYAKGLDAGMSGLRRDHFRLQLRVLEGRLPVYVVVSDLPPVSPTTMEKGPEAAAQALRCAGRALASAPAEFDAD